MYFEKVLMQQDAMRLQISQKSQERLPEEDDNVSERALVGLPEYWNMLDFASVYCRQIWIM